MGITIRELPGGGAAGAITLTPYGALNDELEVLVSGGGLGTPFPSGAISALRDFPFAVSFEPAAAFPFRGWQMTRGGAAVANWRPDGAAIPDAPGWDVLWEPRNASGTEMEMTIRELPAGTGPITVMPYGAQNEELEVVVSGGGLGTPFPSGTLTGIRRDFPFAVNFQPAASFPFRGWQLTRDGETIASWRPEGELEVAPGWEILWEPRNASGTDMGITIRALPAANAPLAPAAQAARGLRRLARAVATTTTATTGGPITLSPYGALNETLDVIASPAGLGTAFPSGPIAGVRRDFPFAVSFEPAAAFPFRGWQLTRGGAQVASWRPEGEPTAAPGWEVLWEPRNASGTDMGITICAIPDGTAAPITVMPLGGEAGVVAAGIEFSPAWGTSSPPPGALQGRREGFPFAVEFAPSDGFHFYGWRAYGAGNQRLDTGATPTVAIAREEGGRATVTVNTTAQVRLVPHSLERPRLDPRTNPPLVAVPSPFPFEQQVNIWFSSEIDRSTVVMYQGGNAGYSVRVSAIHAAGANRGQPFRGHGDATGHFALEFPAGYANRITLRPSNAPGHPAAELAHLTISVTVGPGIRNAAGVPMARAETVTFLTDASVVQRVYAPGPVSARRDADSAFFDDGMPWNNPQVARRLNPGNPNLNAVHVRIDGIAPPEGEAPPLPNQITIVERLSHNPTGFPLPGSTLERTYQTSQFAVDGNVWTISHQLMTTQPGIVQIVALPWYYAGGATIARQDLAEAVAAGAFVTVVVDNVPPTPPAQGASLSEPSSVDGGVYVYGLDAPISLTLGGAAQMSDNAGIGGILPAAAWGSPWTMDGREDLEWEARIGTGAVTSGWRPAGGSDRWDFDGHLAPDENHGVYVRARDRMGNMSDWTTTGLRLRRTHAQILSVSYLRAEVNAAGNSVAVTWTEPAGGYLFPEVVIRAHRSTPTGDLFENETRHRLAGPAGGHSFSVPPISTAGVRDGNPVTGVFGYEISVITHNVGGTATAGPIWVYNIPGMETRGTGYGTDSNTVRITGGSLAGLIAGNDSAGTNFVLTRDFDLPGNWTPVGGGGTAIATSAFQGRFYGNGRTVTINGMNPAANMGLFGLLYRNAVVRDLTVRYGAGSPVAITGPALVSRFGGIAGDAAGYARLENVLAKGGVSVSFGNHTSTAGGIAGRMGGTSSARNAFGGLSLWVERSGDGLSLWVGGIAGETTGNAVLEEASAEADITVGEASPVNVATGNTGTNAGLFVGGIVEIARGDLLRDSEYRRGAILVRSGLGHANVGGAVGRTDGGITVTDSAALQGGFDVFKVYNGFFSVGGFLGHAHVGSSISNSRSHGPVTVSAAEVVTNMMSVGGFAGGTWSQVSISHSHALGDVSALAYAAMRIGGFVGALAVGEAVSHSFAAGNVSAVSRGTGELMVGGLAGMAHNVHDSHALGNVFAHAEGTRTVRAGALVGSVGASGAAAGGLIERNFAVGNVIAQRSDGPAVISAGGLVGHVWVNDVTIRNNAALGSSISLFGTTGISGQRTFNRVLGHVQSAAFADTLTLDNNRAHIDMRLLHRRHVTDREPTQIPFDPPTPGAQYIASNPAGRDGSDAHHGDFRSRAFWTALFADDAHRWDFTTVESRGHPILRDLPRGSQVR